MAAFIVRIWGGENGVFQLLVEWNVDLNGLTYLDEKVSISLYNPPMCYSGAGCTPWMVRSIGHICISCVICDYIHWEFYRSVKMEIVMNQIRSFLVYKMGIMFPRKTPRFVLLNHELFHGTRRMPSHVLVPSFSAASFPGTSSFLCAAPNEKLKQRT